MLKLDRIISVSSEDPSYPAENLLKDDGKNKKWKCRSSGEKNATVVIQLEKSSKIKAIDIGNENSAFIEILVGKSCLPDDDYKVLLVASSLMSLKEAKDLTNSNGVRFFKESNFCKPDCNEKWDRIKIVCSQPYNKHVQFGLSFIKLHGDVASDPSGVACSSAFLTNSDNKVGGLGRFLFKKDNDNDIAVGSIFARRKELQDEEKKTSAVAIRTATSQLLNNDVLPKKNPIKKRPNSTTATPVQENHSQHTSMKTSPNSAKRKEPNKRPKPDVDADTPETKKVKKDPVRNNDVGASAIHQNERINKLPTPSSKQKLCRPFNQLMKDVVFTISGFQNPLRGEIRSKALSMGAKYKPDWDGSCSHLVCAFSNTPKFNQVKGHGRIVKKEWIEVCYSQRRRIPWRRFALDPPDSKKPESEDEICEESNLPSVADDAGPSLSNGRLNDQGQKTETAGSSLFGNLVKPTSSRNRRQAKDTKPTLPMKFPKLSPVSRKTTERKDPKEEDDLMSVDAGSGSNKASLYVDLNLEEVSDLHAELVDTDSDHDWLDKPDSSCFPYLPEQFNDLSFYIADDFPTSIRDDLKRYIIAHSGTVLEHCNQDTEFVIAATSSTMLELKESWPGIVGVKAEWVWRCHDENRLLPTSAFEF